VLTSTRVRNGKPLSLLVRSASGANSPFRSSSEGSVMAQLAPIGQVAETEALSVHRSSPTLTLSSLSSETSTSSNVTPPALTVPLATSTPSLSNTAASPSSASVLTVRSTCSPFEQSASPSSAESNSSDALPNETWHVPPSGASVTSTPLV